MISDYKNHFEDVENIIQAHEKISEAQILATSSLLQNILSHTQFSDIDNRDSFLKDIANYVNNGANIDILLQSDIFPQMTQSYLSEWQIALKGQMVGHKFDDFFNLIESISQCNDDGCQQFCEFNGISFFLHSLIENSKEIYLTSTCIQILFKLLFQKPKTSQLFNANNLFSLFYDSFLTKALGKCVIKLFPDEDYQPDLSMTQNDRDQYWHSYCLQKVVIPFCELLIVFFESNPAQFELSQFYQIIVSITSILNKSRSLEQDDLYEEQLALTLPILHHSLTSTRIPDNLKTEFVTNPILSNLLENINRGGKLIKHIFECLLAIANNMSTSIVILTHPNFLNYSIQVDQIGPQLTLIELYCKVWKFSMKAILKFDSKIPGKIQICRDTIIGLGPLLFQKIKEISALCSTYQIEHLTTFILFEYANLNDSSCIEQLIISIPDFIERLNRFFESKELDDIFIAVYALLNIIKFAKNKANEMQIQVAQAILEMKDDLIQNLDEIHDSIKPEEQNLLSLFDSLMTEFQGLESE